MRGMTAILSPKERAVLSIPSRSDLAGKSAAIRAYPGRKSTRGSPSTARRKVVLSEGIRTNVLASIIKIIMSNRSEESFLRFNIIIPKISAS